jgi:hypothetical protein
MFPVLDGRVKWGPIVVVVVVLVFCTLLLQVL